MTTALKTKEERVYSWRGHTRAAVDAQVFGEFVEQFGECCTADALLDKAKGSPIHALFEWKDGIAAHEYRLQQARYYLRSYRVTVCVIEHQTERRNVKATVTRHESVPMHARIHVTTNKLGSTYATPDAVRRDKEALNSALDECLRSLIGLRRRYSFLSELDSVWTAIDRARDRHAKSISA